jgi:DNA-directed RNA polymerase subunit H (RpoH/RPB5)
MDNISKVDLVGDTELEELIEVYGKPSKFQKILVTDPVSRYLDIKVGEVIKITDNTIRYRLCIEHIEPRRGCLVIDTDPGLAYLRT